MYDQATRLYGKLCTVMLPHVLHIFHCCDRLLFFPPFCCSTASELPVKQGLDNTAHLCCCSSLCNLACCGGCDSLPSLYKSYICCKIISHSLESRHLLELDCSLLGHFHMGSIVSHHHVFEVDLRNITSNISHS